MFSPPIARLIAKLFARPQSRRDRRRAARLGVERLEGRDVPTGVVTVEALGTANEDGTGSPLFRFTRTGSLAYEALGTAYLGGTATYSTDYSANPYLWFPIGEDTWDVAIEVVDDDYYEGATAETIIVTDIWLSDTGGSYSLDNPGTAELEIVDDDPAPQVSVERIADAVEGGGTDTFRFSRTGDTSQALVVGYSVETTGDGCATAGTDYTSLSGTVTIGAYTEYADVTVTASTDVSVEGDEWVSVIRYHQQRNARAAKAY